MSTAAGFLIPPIVVLFPFLSTENSKIHFEVDCASTPGDPRNLLFNLPCAYLSERLASWRES
jgi:hypothetical protein